MTSIFDTPLYAYARHADQENKAPRRHPVVIVGAGPVSYTHLTLPTKA